MWILIAPLLFFALVYTFTLLVSAWVMIKGVKEKENPQSKKAQVKNFERKGSDQYQRTYKKSSQNRKRRNNGSYHKPSRTNNGAGKKAERREYSKPSSNKPKAPKQAKPKAVPKAEERMDEMVVTSPIYDGVTIKDLESNLTPDDADTVSAEGYEDVIEAALSRDRERSLLGLD